MSEYRRNKKTEKSLFCDITSRLTLKDNRRCDRKYLHEAARRYLSVAVIRLSIIKQRISIEFYYHRKTTFSFVCDLIDREVIIFFFGILARTGVALMMEQ